MRIAYLCMESVFSVKPLEALLRDGHDVRLLMRPMGSMETRKRQVLRRHRGFDVVVRRAFGLAVNDARDPFALAAQRDIPAYIVGDASAPASLALLAREKIDLVVVAFFNQLLKPAFLQVPRLGAINAHPSLLPTYRGPAPLFWTYRDNVRTTGLTVHRIAPGEDDGDVLLQVLPLPG